MGLLTRLLAPEPTIADVRAQLSPAIWPTLDPFGSAGPSYVSRVQARQVPAVARAENIICGTVGSLPLEVWFRDSGDRAPKPRWLHQPDPNQPGPVTYALTASDLLYLNVAYWQILEVFAEDGRGSAFRRIDPARVTFVTNTDGTLITSYAIDGVTVPMSGVGSLVTFQGFDNPGGVLARAGRTIATALELEKAAQRYAEEPVPAGILKNTGIDLPEEQVEGLLSRWKSSRRTRSTAYLSAALDYQPISFDPKSLQLVEARQQITAEIARAMGIPAWYLNAETASATYSNVSQERRSLIDFGIKNYLVPIEARLSMPDLTPRSQYVAFRLDEFLRGNPLERADVITKLLAAGVISVDEAREWEDLAPRGTTE